MAQPACTGFLLVLVVPVMKLRIFSAVLALITLSIVTPALAQFRPERPDFYEDGQRQLEREIQRLNQQPPADVLTVEGEQSQWQEFTSKDGNFTVLMPGVPAEETEVLETSAGNLELKGFSSAQPASRFVVAYSDYPQTAQLDNSEVILANVRDRIIERVGAQLVSERPISLDAEPGTEVKLESEGEPMIFRLFLVGRRLYILGAGQNNQGSGAEDVAKFLDSFVLLQKPASGR